MTTDGFAFGNFIASVLLGFLLTQFLPYWEAVWWLWPAMRVGWQVGSAVWIGRILGDALGNRAPWMLGAASLGIGISITSTLALVGGPVRGALVEVADGSGWNRSVTIATDADVPLRVWLSRFQVAKLDDLPDCTTQDTRVTVLPALGVLVSAECSPP